MLISVLWYRFRVSVPTLVSCKVIFFCASAGAGCEIVLLVLVPVPVSSAYADGNRIIGSGAGVS